MTVTDLFESPIPASGPAKLKRETAASAFDGQWWCITQYGAEFRLHSDHPKKGFKITLIAEDALWLIEELSLGANPSALFRRAVTWRK